MPWKSWGTKSSEWVTSVQEAGLHGPGHPQQIGNSSSHSTQPEEWNSRARNGPSLQYYEWQAWNTAFRFGPCYKKGCGLAGQSPERDHKDEQRRGKPGMWEKAERTWEKMAGGDNFTMFLYLKDSNKDQTPFYKGVIWKRWGVMGTSNSWGESSWTQNETFMRIISPRKWWIDWYWTLLGFVWTESFAGPSCLDCAFARKGWTRWSWRSLPTWNSMIIWTVAIKSIKWVCAGVLMTLESNICWSE